MTEATKRIVSISKEELASLPAADFHAGLRLIDNNDDVEDAVADLAASDIIGFDTETRPSFKRGISYKVSLLQLSTRKVCYLFRLNKIGLPESLVRLLADPSKLKIGVSVHDDFHNLMKLVDFTPEGFIDLQAYVKDFMIADNSLSRLYGIVFGKRISKAQRLTNWEADKLTKAQQTYAAMDALACIDLYDCLSTGNFDPQASPYMREVDPITSQPKITVSETEPANTSEASPALLEVLSHALEVMQSHTVLPTVAKKKTSRKPVKQESTEAAPKTKTTKKAAATRKSTTTVKATATKKTTATTKSATKKKSATKPEVTPVIVRPAVETIPGIKKYAFIYSGNLSSK
ncbi:MAG: 3'-5' exonuclease domain-containing protein 2 [Muribaculaceae bacterium]|nr:3'-5' exonuclease domain-containing protein 2 [Muribaculaceae bacterium]